jgi:hypothetical protein
MWQSPPSPKLNVQDHAKSKLSDEDKMEDLLEAGSHGDSLDSPVRLLLLPLFFAGLMIPLPFSDLILPPLGRQRKRKRRTCRCTAHHAVVVSAVTSVTSF